MSESTMNAEEVVAGEKKRKEEQERPKPTPRKARYLTKKWLRGHHRHDMKHVPQAEYLTFSEYAKKKYVKDFVSRYSEGTRRGVTVALAKVMNIDPDPRAMKEHEKRRAAMKERRARSLARRRPKRVAAPPTNKEDKKDKKGRKGKKNN